MTNKLEQAARQALEALEYLPEMRGIDEAIAALRKALAEPELNLNCKSVQKRLATVWGYVRAEQAEQEPVATVVDESEEQTNTMSWILSLPLPVGTKLYAAPVRTKDLTDDEIEIAMEASDIPYYDITNSDLIDFARSVIEKFKEKNK